MKKISIEFPTEAMRNDVVASAASGLELKYLMYPEILWAELPEKDGGMLEDAFRRQGIPYTKSTESRVVVSERHDASGSVVETEISGDFVGRDMVLGVIRDGSMTPQERLDALAVLLGCED